MSGWGVLGAAVEEGAVRVLEVAFQVLLIVTCRPRK